jgi:purine-binding chemotaxis protein CheW
VQTSFAQHVAQPFGTHLWLNTDVVTRQDRGGDAERQLVVFTLHGDRFAVPIETVREIVRYTPPAAGAAASGLVRGMINLRGVVVPVADLSDRLGHGRHTGENAQIVVLELRDGPLGLIVDHVKGVHRVPRAQINPTPVPGAEQGFGDEIAAIDDELVLLLDPERVLGSQLRRPAARAPRGAAKPAAVRAPRGAAKPAAVRAPRGAAKPAAVRAPRDAAEPAAAPTKAKRSAGAKAKPPANAKPKPPAKPPAKRRSPTRRPPAA